MLFWIAAIIVTNVATAIFFRRIKKTPELTLLDKITITETEVWREGFNDGWNAVLNDYSTMKRRITELETPSK